MAVEWVLHLLAIGLVAWAWWRNAHPMPAAGTAIVSQRGGALPAALARWSTDGDVAARVHVRFAAVPDATTRDWLAALARAGTTVSWGGDGAALPATAIDVEPIADPIGLQRASVAAPKGATVVLGDGLGVLDSAVTPSGLVTFRLPEPSGVVTAGVGGTVARAIPADSLTLRRLYVVGGAGWETKFVVRALEEEGWAVDARVEVGPAREVEPAKPIELDTARYAAVVALDSAVARDAPRVARYVASGGGLVIAPAAATVLPSLIAGGAGGMVKGAAVLDDSAPRRGLTLVPVARFASGAVVIERRDSMVTVVDRYVGSGRVAQIGYTDTWRWRMAAGDSGAAAYRDWWSSLVADVAAAPSTARAAALDAEPAPFVAAAERLGGPVDAPLLGRAPADSRWPVWVFASLMIGLIVEWASRRWRGAR